MVLRMKLTYDEIVNFMAGKSNARKSNAGSTNEFS